MSCRDGSTTLVTATLSGGKATCTLPLLAKGTHSINAVYAGSAAYAARDLGRRTLTSADDRRGASPSRFRETRCPACGQRS